MVRSLLRLNRSHQDRRSLQSLHFTGMVCHHLITRWATQRQRASPLPLHNWFFLQSYPRKMQSRLITSRMCWTNKPNENHQTTMDQLYDSRMQLSYGNRVARKTSHLTELIDFEITYRPLFGRPIFNAGPFKAGPGSVNFENLFDLALIKFSLMPPLIQRRPKITLH